MPAGWAAAAATVAGGLMQADAAGDAADKAAQGASNSLALQSRMFDTQNAQQEPYRQAGYSALSALLSGYGLPDSSKPGGMQHRLTTAETQSPEFKNVAEKIYGQYGGFNSDKFLALPQAQQQALNTQASAEYNNLIGAKTGGQQPSESGGVPVGFFSHQFGANDLNANLAPNWQFGLQQGINAGKNAGNLQTGLISGNTMKGLADYTVAKSGDLYQQAYNNFTANQSNIANRLTTLAGLGSAANQQSAGLAGSLAPSMGQAASNIGAAQAAGTIGSANALAGAGQNAMGWYQLNNLSKPAAASNDYLSPQAGMDLTTAFGGT